MLAMVHRTSLRTVSLRRLDIPYFFAFLVCKLFVIYFYRNYEPHPQLSALETAQSRLGERYGYTLEKANQ